MMDKVYKRAIRATLHRASGKSTEVIFTRFYSKVATALSKGVFYAILEGQPGDVLELTSSNYGYLIATLALRVGSKGFSTMRVEFHVVADKYSAIAA